MTTSESSIICPVCDAPNGPRSVFCAECGSSLTGTTSYTEELPAAPAERDSQSTSVISVASPWSTGDTSSKPVPAAFPSQGPSEPLVDHDETFESANAYLALPRTPTVSRRSFWLGLIAFLLMLIVLVLWIWATILSESSRNSIEDLFGFLG